MKMVATHQENAELAERVNSAAAKADKSVRHNATSWSNHDGMHRYCVFSEPQPSDYRCNSKACEVYYETRYSRMGKPSVRGEAACLRAVLDYLS